MKSEDAKGVSAIKFNKVTDFTTFDAEYAFVDDDIVFHFFLPDDIETQAGGQVYWKSRFPEALDKCAQEFWAADATRLKAAYTEELNSWWLRCLGFANSGDPDSRVRRFLVDLDIAIERRG